MRHGVSQYDDPSSQLLRGHYQLRSSGGHPLWAEKGTSTTGSFPTVGVEMIFVEFFFPVPFSKKKSLNSSFGALRHAGGFKHLENAQKGSASLTFGDLSKHSGGVSRLS